MGLQDFGRTCEALSQNFQLLQSLEQSLIFRLHESYYFELLRMSGFVYYICNLMPMMQAAKLTAFNFADFMNSLLILLPVTW